VSDGATCGPCSPAHAGRWAAAAALLHLAAAAVHIARGLTIRHDFGPSTWDFFWQNLSTADLRERALQSLWYLHTQPPFWNAFNAPLVKIFGDLQPEALQLLHLLMGAAMAVLIATRLTASVAAGVVAGALVALDPALVLYEAYALYETLCAFLVMVMFLALVKAGPEGRTGPLLVVLAALSVLVLTRSLFHLALLVPAVAGAAVLARRPRLVLVWGAAFALLPAG